MGGKPSPSTEVTAVIPFLKGARKDWLKIAIGSLPQGMPYIVAENDGEMTEAMNAAFDAVETEWVCPTGHDDRWEPGAIEAMLEISEGADVIYPSVIGAEEESFLAKDRKPSDPFCPHRLLIWNYIPGVGLWRTSKVREVGGERPGLESLEDWEIMVRLSRAGAVFRPCPNAWYRYRQVEGSRNWVAADRTNFRQEMQDRIVGERPEFIAEFVYSQTPGSTYVRAQMPAKHLPGFATIAPEIVLGQDEHGTKMGFPDLPPNVVWSFPGTDYQAIIVASMQESGHKVFAEVDDNYLSPGGSSRGMWDKKHNPEKPSHWVHKRIIENVDGVICATEALARIYRKVNENVYVCPNQVDPDDWPELRKPDDGIFRIGVSGGSAHLDDIGVVLPALEWASKQPNVEIMVLGMLKKRPGPKGLVPIFPNWNFPYTYVDWSTDLYGYRKNLMLLDVGLCPVKDTPWNRCKSDLKVLEHSMAGVASIVSDVEPYKGWKGGPVLHARTAKDFTTQVRWAVENREGVHDLAVRARDVVMSERTMQKNVGCWKQVFQSYVDTSMPRGIVRAGIS